MGSFFRWQLILNANELCHYIQDGIRHPWEDTFGESSQEGIQDAAVVQH